MAEDWEVELSGAELGELARIVGSTDELQRLGFTLGTTSPPGRDLAEALAEAGALDADRRPVEEVGALFEVLAAPEAQWTVVASGPEWSSSTSLLLANGRVVEHEEPFADVHRLQLFPADELLLRLCLLAGSVRGDAPAAEPFVPRLDDLERWLDEGGHHPPGGPPGVWESLHERRTVSVLSLEPADDDEVQGSVLQWLVAPAGVWFIDEHSDGDDVAEAAEDGDAEREASVRLTPASARDVFDRLAEALPDRLRPPPVEEDAAHPPTGDFDA